MSQKPSLEKIQESAKPKTTMAIKKDGSDKENISPLKSVWKRSVKSLTWNIFRRPRFVYEKRNTIISNDLWRELFLMQLRPRRRRKADTWHMYSGRTRKRTVEARRPQDGCTHRRKWTQGTRVLDVVFDKLYLFAVLYTGQ